MHVVDEMLIEWTAIDAAIEATIKDALRAQSTANTDEDAWMIFRLCWINFNHWWRGG